MNAVVALDGVGKRYGAITALADVSLQVQPGEVLALVGHNGAGKTTLMKLMLGLIKPSEGSVRVVGLDPSGRSGAAVRRLIGFLPENVAFPAAMTGREVIAFYCRLKGEPAAGSGALLERVGLAEAGDRRVATYSKGMRQRLGLAQALIGRPSLLLLDEPTTGLDPALRRDFYGMIDVLRDSGVAVVLSSHALAEIEDRADRFALVDRGRLLACADYAALRHDADLPIRLRVVVRPCTTGTAIERLGGLVTVEARAADHVVLACRPADKLAVLNTLSGLDEVVRDIDIDRPGLDEIYRLLSDRHRRNQS
jgi:Cu-processing system ATP-binding protein